MKQQVVAEDRTDHAKAAQHAAKMPLATPLFVRLWPELLPTVANHSVLRCSSSVVQAKLVLGRPGDHYEQEADRVAEAVLRMPGPAPQRQEEPEEEEEEVVQAQPVGGKITPLVQRQAGPEEEPGEGLIQPKTMDHCATSLVQRGVEEDQPEETAAMVQAKAASTSNPVTTSPLSAQINALRGGGQPLCASVRTFFEPRFGCDFGQVRVHTDPQAAATARMIRAQAFTVGRDIVFDARRYTPETPRGQLLLAHELAHVIQQGRVSPVRESNLMGCPNCILEKEIVQRKLSLVRTSVPDARRFFEERSFKAFSLRKGAKGLIETKAIGSRPGPPALEQEVLWSLMNSERSEFKMTLAQLGEYVDRTRIIVNSAWTLVRRGTEKGHYRYPEFGGFESIREKGSVRFNRKHWRLRPERVQLGRRQVIDVVIESMGSPSAAVEDIWSNPKEYTYECLASVELMELRSYLRRVGNKRFDERFRKGITLRFTVRRGFSEEKTLRPELQELGLGTVDLRGEDKYEELIPGDMCFLRFTDEYGHGLGNGQNMIYVGGGKYYAHPLGIKLLEDIKGYWRIMGHPYQRLSRFVDRWKIRP